LRFKNWKIVLSIALVALSSLVFYSYNSHIVMNKKLRVWTKFAPYSADPMEYDQAVHHLTMRSVLASLVSTYKNGSIEPQIAKSWSSKNNLQEWELILDSNWTFENGEKITSNIVLKNLTRVLYLKNYQDSKSGLLEFLVDASTVNNIDAKFKGLTAGDNSITFKFIKPMPDFLEKISFGLYGIANPVDFDVDGKWKSARKVIASGKYKVKNWNDEKIELVRRSEFRESDSIDEVEFFFSSDPEQILKSDIVVKEKNNNLLDPNKWYYASTTLDNNITYVKVMKWNVPSSPFSKREVRKKLRSVFYKSLIENGVTVTPSFFPLSIKGINTFSYEEEKVNWKGESFSTQPFFSPRISGFNNAKKELGDLYLQSFNSFCKKINANGVINQYPEDAASEKDLFDIQFLGTAIFVASPVDDIRFMFLSKQSINLPDETGEIIKEVSKENLSIQKVNEFIWEQAIIWPIRHFSAGFWVNNKSKINISNLNTSIHPMDLQFLKWD